MLIGRLGAANFSRENLGRFGERDSKHKQALTHTKMNTTIGAKSTIGSTSPRATVRRPSMSGSSIPLDNLHPQILDTHIMKKLPIRDVAMFRIAYPPGATTGCPTRILRLMAGVRTRINTYSARFPAVDRWMDKKTTQAFMNTFAACKERAEAYPVKQSSLASHASQASQALLSNRLDSLGSTSTQKQPRANACSDAERRRRAVLMSCSAWCCWQIDSRVDIGGGGLASWHTLNAIVAWATGAPAEMVEEAARQACKLHDEKDPAETLGFDECTIARMRAKATELLNHGGQPFSTDVAPQTDFYHTHVVRVFAEFLDSMPFSDGRYIPL